MRKQANREERSRSGFTLIEVMLVVIIIGILATVVVTKFTGQSERARINATHMSIQNVCTAIGAYETETGKLPVSLSELTKETEDHGALLAGMPTDSWGTELQYKTTGKFSFEVRSAGPDGQFGNQDDLINK